MEIYEFGNSSSDIVLVQPVDEHDMENLEKEISLISEYSGKDFYLIAVKIHDWNFELSPWNAPAVFGKEDFGDGASDTLKEILELCNDVSKKYYIGGYSLAGLFSLWASYQTDLFCGVAAASPSIWFPGFTDYMKDNEPRCDKVYLSLGNKEEKAKNPVMATVGERIKVAYEVLQEKKVDCILEWNEGSHFKDADIRTAKAFAWVLK